MVTVTETKPTRKRRKRKATVESIPDKSSSGIDYDSLPFNMVVHGISGIGKTSFAANAPKPHFLIDRQERGILKLQKRKILSRSTPVDEMRSW